jgi:hypothetical protein
MKVLFTPESLRRVLATLLMIAFLAPSSLGWRGMIECAKRCHLAYTTGAHCPLRYQLDSHAKPATPHCPMHEKTKVPHAEWHCACGAHSPTSTADTTLTYFLVSSLVELLAPPQGVPGSRETLACAPTRVFSPPDPPPRLFFLMFV